MAWAYNPRDAADCLPPGNYDATLEKVEETVSSKGNPMLALEWLVQTSERVFRIKDYIVNPLTLFRLKHIARAVGELKDFELGILDLTQHKGKIVNLKLDVENSEKYGDRNKILEYREGRFEPSQPVRVRDANAEDQIPF